MSEREDAARRFAEKMGKPFRYQPGDPKSRWFYGVPRFYPTDAPGDDGFEFPAADAPLHEHLEFVGRVAEALGDVRIGRLGQYLNGTWFIHLARTSREDWLEVVQASDLSWAAMLAATATKERT